MPKVTVTTTVQYTKSGRCSMKCPHLRETIYPSYECTIFCTKLEYKNGRLMRHRKCIESENGGKK